MARHNNAAAGVDTDGWASIIKFSILTGQISAFDRQGKKKTASDQMTWRLHAAHLELAAGVLNKTRAGRARPSEQPTTTCPLLLPLHLSSLRPRQSDPAAMASRAGAPLRHRPPSPCPALLALAALLSILPLAHLAAASRLPSTLPLPGTTATAATPLESAGGEVDVVLAGGVERRACTYTVEIKTSCSSPRTSRDAVSLAFGDVYRNEVYAASVSPAYGFERCAKDTFKVSGPCGYGVCYLYLRRTGSVGWTPEWVRVYEPTSSTPSTFYFGDPLANGVWYGTDRCLRRAAAGDGAEPEAKARAL